MIPHVCDGSWKCVRRTVQTFGVWGLMDIPAPIANAPEPPTPASRRKTISCGMLLAEPAIAVKIRSSGSVVQYTTLRP